MFTAFDSEILDKAMCFFAEKDYDGVFVRDISWVVGIRESFSVCFELF